VPRAFDLVADQQAFSQRSAVVRAHIIYREDGSTNSAQGKPLIARLSHNRSALSHIARGCHTTSRHLRRPGVGE
jgi:hypothetical protein